MVSLFFFPSLLFFSGKKEVGGSRHRTIRSVGEGRHLPPPWLPSLPPFFGEKKIAQRVVDEMARMALPSPFLSPFPFPPQQRVIEFNTRVGDSGDGGDDVRGDFLFLFFFFSFFLFFL